MPDVRAASNRHAGVCRFMDYPPPPPPPPPRARPPPRDIETEAPREAPPSAPVQHFSQPPAYAADRHAGGSGYLPPHLRNRDRVRFLLQLTHACVHYQLLPLHFCTLYLRESKLRGSAVSLPVLHKSMLVLLEQSWSSMVLL